MKKTIELSKQARTKGIQEQITGHVDLTLIYIFVPLCYFHPLILVFNGVFFFFFLFPCDYSIFLVKTNTKSTASRYCPLWPIAYHRQPHSFKTRLLGRGFHTLIRNVSFPSPTDVGSHNPSPLEAQRPRNTSPGV